MVGLPTVTVGTVTSRGKTPFLVCSAMAAWLAVVIGVQHGVLAQQTAGTKLLRYKFQPDQQFDITITQKAHIVANFPGQPAEMDHTYTWYLSEKVTGVDPDGSSTIELRFRRIVLSISGGAQQSTYDTDKDDVPSGILEQLVPVLKILTNHPFQLHVTATGSITDVEVSDAFAEAIRGAAIPPSLSEMLSKEGLKQFLRNNFLVLPENPVSKGESWKQVTQGSDALYGKHNLITTYTYDGEESRNGQKVDRIRIKVTVEVKNEDQAEARAKLQELNIQGLLQIDGETGWPVRADLTDKTVMLVNGMFSQTIETKTTLEAKNTASVRAAARE
jgi:hypothetical protein